MKKNYNQSVLGVFASYIKPHWREFATDMGLSVLIAGVDLVFPILSRWSMRELLPQSLFRTFFTVMAIIFAAYILRAVAQYVVTVVGHRMGTMVEADMRRDVFTHMQELSYSFFDHNRTGVLLSRVTNDLFEIVELAHHGPENILTCTRRRALHSSVRQLEAFPRADRASAGLRHFRAAAADRDAERQ